jgi:hypothetical protein
MPDFFSKARASLSFQRPLFQLCTACCLVVEVLVGFSCLHRAVIFLLARHARAVISPNPQAVDMSNKRAEQFQPSKEQKEEAAVRAHHDLIEER